MQWIGRRNTMPPGKPEREMAAGGMAIDDDSAEIEAVLACQAAYKVGGRGHVLKRSGPAATRVSDASILDVPRRESNLRQSMAQMTSVEQMVFRSPEPSVNVDDHRMRSRPFRQPKV